MGEGGRGEGREEGRKGEREEEGGEREEGGGREGEKEREGKKGCIVTHSQAKHVSGCIHYYECRQTHYMIVCVCVCVCV